MKTIGFVLVVLAVLGLFSCGDADEEALEQGQMELDVCQDPKPKLGLSFP